MYWNNRIFYCEVVSLYLAFISVFWNLFEIQFYIRGIFDGGMKIPEIVSWLRILNYGPMWTRGERSCRHRRLVNNLVSPSQWLARLSKNSQSWQLLAQSWQVSVSTFSKYLGLEKSRARQLSKYQVSKSHLLLFESCRFTFNILYGLSLLYHFNLMKLKSWIKQILVSLSDNPSLNLSSSWG